MPCARLNNGANEHLRVGGATAQAFDRIDAGIHAAIIRISGFLSADNPEVDGCVVMRGPQ